MGVTHIPLAEAESNLAELLERVDRGEQVAIDSGAKSFVIQPAVRKGRTVEESLALALEYEQQFPEPPYMDQEFARDAQAAIAMRRPRRVEYDEELDG